MDFSTASVSVQPWRMLAEGMRRARIALCGGSILAVVAGTIGCALIFAWLCSLIVVADVNDAPPYTRSLLFLSTAICSMRFRKSPAHRRRRRRRRITACYLGSQSP